MSTEQMSYTQSWYCRMSYTLYRDVILSHANACAGLIVTNSRLRHDMEDVTLGLKPQRGQRTHKLPAGFTASCKEFLLPPCCSVVQIRPGPHMVRLRFHRIVTHPENSSKRHKTGPKRHRTGSNWGDPGRRPHVHAERKCVKIARQSFVGAVSRQRQWDKDDSLNTAVEHPTAKMSRQVISVSLRRTYSWRAFAIDALAVDM